MMGSLDYIHWEWKNYPLTWKGQFEHKDCSKTTIILEALTL